MSRRFSEVSQAYVKNAYNLDLARREFEKQALAIIEHVESDLNNVSRRHSTENDLIRWRSPERESPQREIAWLNFRATAWVTLDVKPKGFRNFKKEAAFLYFEILFDEDRHEFIFQARFENQSVHQGLDDYDEKIIELARSNSEKANFPDSNHIKASTAIVYKHALDESLFENLSPRIKHAIEICEKAIVQLMPQVEEGKVEANVALVR